MCTLSLSLSSLNHFSFCVCVRNMFSEILSLLLLLHTLSPYPHPNTPFPPPPQQSQMSSITSIAWKSHEIVLSDADGNLTVWDLKTRISRHISTHRGWVRKVRFAPGRDNIKLLVLLADGVDVWDVRDVSIWGCVLNLT